MSFPSRCIDLTLAQVVRGLHSKEKMRALLQHMADVAKPGEGAPKVLVPIARMASTDCTWLGGALTVTITGTSEATRIQVELDAGGGPKLLFPRLLLDVPMDEFVRAVKLAPKIVKPMAARFEKGGIVLGCEAAAVGVSKPTAFDVAEAGIRKSLPPSLRRSLPPIASGPVSVRVDMPVIDEAALLKSEAFRRQATPKIVEELDAGWDENEAPTLTMPRAPSKAPGRGSKAPGRGSKAPGRGSKAPERASKAPAARASKAPPPFKAPARPALPAPRPGIPRPAPKKP